MQIEIKANELVKSLHVMDSVSEYNDYLDRQMTIKSSKSGITLLSQPTGNLSVISSMKSGLCHKAGTFTVDGTVLLHYAKSFLSSDTLMLIDSGEYLRVSLKSEQEKYNNVEIFKEAVPSPKLAKHTDSVIIPRKILIEGIKELLPSIGSERANLKYQILGITVAETHVRFSTATGVSHVIDDPRNIHWIDPSKRWSLILQRDEVVILKDMLQNCYSKDVTIKTVESTQESYILITHEWATYKFNHTIEVGNMKLFIDAMTESEYEQYT